MGRRLLILSAGAGGSINLVRSLRAGDPSLFLVGCHHDRFLLRLSQTDKNYVTPAPSRPGFLAALQRVIELEAIELAIACSDEDVRRLSRLRSNISCRVFLPRSKTIGLCQDKYRMISFFASRGVPVPATYALAESADIGRLFRRFRAGSPVWCRLRSGYGAMGAIPAGTAKEARQWIKEWQERRGIPPSAFILSEFLPGRDFACQMLWQAGELVLAKTSERLSYLIPASLPVPVSSVARLSKTVFEPRVVEICTQAVRALDRRATGVFSLDLKENVEGVPCITEINAGRFSSGTNLLDLTGKHNMAVTSVRLALGERVEIGDVYDVAEDYYMLRDLDTPPAIFHADEVFEAIG